MEKNSTDYRTNSRIGQVRPKTISKTQEDVTISNFIMGMTNQIGSDPDS
ncbi:Hypothetical protein I595_1756 [Croceitalea dokdonensis DOKDO 023]|uniref:Uncharacterized protein n=1 Tax=Croceitalea dokdonensis DOKDO 023 TaxID=1300341 RepID=A0A0P7AVZ8_9FLAO|nr:hypothetical protein [Croceitalea dokdonensis]KPM32107.1 Hypothetical protein I595_1756 [Croceitalea dokdonensis DOKDO 023]